KTTLLKRLAQGDLLQQHVPVMFDMQGSALGMSVGKLFFNLAKEIQRAMADRGFPVPEARRRDYFAKEEDPTYTFECFLDTIHPMLGNRKLILLLDEFEILEEQVKKGNLPQE